MYVQLMAKFLVQYLNLELGFIMLLFNYKTCSQLQ